MALENRSNMNMKNRILVFAGMKTFKSKSQLYNSIIVKGASRVESINEAVYLQIQATYAVYIIVSLTCCYAKFGVQTVQTTTECL